MRCVGSISANWRGPNPSRARAIARRADAMTEDRLEANAERTAVISTMIANQCAT